MNIQEASKAALQYSFIKYKENPSRPVDLTESVLPTGFNPQVIGKHLLDEGFIKNPVYLPPNKFLCEITFNGINQISPEYIVDNTNKIISYLGMQGGSGSIMEILGIEREKFHAAFQFAKYLESLGLIKEGIYVLGDVQIQLSTKGFLFYEENKVNWL